MGVLGSFDLFNYYRISIISLAFLCLDTLYSGRTISSTLFFFKRVLSTFGTLLFHGNVRISSSSYIHTHTHTCMHTFTQKHILSLMWFWLSFHQRNQLRTIDIFIICIFKSWNVNMIYLFIHSIVLSFFVYFLYSVSYNILWKWLVFLNF